MSSIDKKQISHFHATAKGRCSLPVTQCQIEILASLVKMLSLLTAFKTRIPLEMLFFQEDLRLHTRLSVSLLFAYSANCHQILRFTKLGGQRTWAQFIVEQKGLIQENSFC